MPCTLKLNGEDAAPSSLVYAGDAIEFIPAVSGQSAQRTARDLLGEDFLGGVLINGRPAALDSLLHSGDQLTSTEEPFDLAALEAEPEPEAVPAAEPEIEAEPPDAPSEPAAEAAPPEPAEPSPPREAEEVPPEPEEAVTIQRAAPEPAPRPAKPAAKPLWIYLNGQALVLPAKEDGSPYYLMDLLDRSGIDFETLDCPVALQVNGADCPFTQELRNNDQVAIRREERRSL